MFAYISPPECFDFIIHPEERKFCRYSGTLQKIKNSYLKVFWQKVLTYMQKSDIMGALVKSLSKNSEEIL